MKKKYEKILACKRRTQYRKIIEMLSHIEMLRNLKRIRPANCTMQVKFEYSYVPDIFILAFGSLYFFYGQFLRQYQELQNVFTATLNK